MRLHIIIILILSLCTDKVHAGPKEELEQQLLVLEHQIFLSKSEGEKVEFCFQKMQLYIAANNYSSSALAEGKRVDYTALRDSSSQKKYLWNAALLAYLNHDFNFSVHYYSAYQKLFNDSSIEGVLLGVLINSSMDSVSLNAPVAYLSHLDPQFNALLCLKEASAYSRRNEGLFVAASAIIPGSGSMLNGNVAKGTTSLLLNAASVTGITLLAQNGLYANAVIWGMMVGLKFYTGNILLTKSLFEQKEMRIKNKLAENCELIVKDILKDYPLYFK
jgi:hypothetical protein